MLSEFITTYRDAIIERAQAKLTARPWPAATAVERENGVPLFLTQLTATLDAERNDSPHSSAAMDLTACHHGGQLLALGFTVSQVVHDYGDICQAVTELAMEQNAPITTEEFHTLNRSLDTAIASAVTEYARITSESRTAAESERSGQVAHDCRDHLNTAVLAFEALKRGNVAINGSTGAVLARSLGNLSELIERQLSEVRMSAKGHRGERISLASFLNEIAVVGMLQSESRGQTFTIDRVDPAPAIVVDAQILASAVTNVLNNAFKFSRPGGRIVLRGHQSEARVVIEVEDECGGLSDTQGDLFQPFQDRRGTDRSGLGLGLSIARKAAVFHGGDIAIRNIPGKGCVVTIEVPAAPQAVAAPVVSA